MLAAALVEHLLPRHEVEGYAAVGHREAPAGKIGDAGELPADMVSGSARKASLHSAAISQPTRVSLARSRRSMRSLGARVADAVDPGRIKPRGLTLIDEVFGDDRNDRPHRDSSPSSFGRHPTGSAIQRVMSDSCQPVPLALIFS